MRNPIGKHLYGYDFGLKHADENRIFRCFNPPDRYRRAYWSVGELMWVDGKLHSCVLGLNAADKERALEDGHTDEYVGFVDLFTNSDGDISIRGYMFGAQAGGHVARVYADDRSLKDAMRVIEACWMQGLISEKLGGQPR